jgi:hypothetical protein
VLVALGAFAFSQLPEGSYPTDLTRIGQGQAAVVLVMDSNYLDGAAVMHLMHDVRDEFRHSVHFLAASMGRDDGRAFAEQHQVSDGHVLLFDARGQRVAVLRAPQSQKELRDAVRDAFGL